MNKRFALHQATVLCLLLMASTICLAQKVDKNIKDEASQSTKAAKVFREIMNTPDKEVPRSVLDGAECVGVFPDVIKAGFIVGGRGGRGVISCRTANGWSPPAYFNLGGGSFGLQIGAQSTDFVLLFMNKDAVNSLLKSKLTLGADASAAAGPVGREAGASTDARLNAQILSYSRSKGLFAGLELSGVVIEVDESDMRDAYGSGVKATQVLRERVNAPSVILDFPKTLERFSAKSAQK